MVTQIVLKYCTHDLKEEFLQLLIIFMNETLLLTYTGYIYIRNLSTMASQDQYTCTKMAEVHVDRYYSERQL